MPWQQQVIDVGLEIDPETGLFAYREVILTIMRQQGKTVVIFGVELDRCTMWGPRQRVIYTAQTGSDARKKLLEDQVPMIKGSPLAALVQKIHQAQGNEGIIFKNGSRIGVAASSQDAAHGFTLDLGVLDECWRDEDDRREQAMIPAMNTRPMAQIWVASTQGTEKSSYLNRKTEMGRAAAAADQGSGIAYFEWSIPADEDIEDPEVWWTYMPALGWTIQPNAVAHALRTMDEAEWRRAFGNQRTRAAQERVISDIVWDQVQNTRAEVGRKSAVSFGLDVHPDRTSAAIVASDGQTVELIDYRSGTNWVLERAKALLERWRGRFVIDGGGPAVSVASDLEGEGLPVDKFSSAEVAAACARIYDALADSKLQVRTAEVLDIAVAGLAKRPVGDRFVWARSTSQTDITPFMAATLAYDHAARREDPAEVTFIRFD